MTARSTPKAGGTMEHARIIKNVDWALAPQLDVGTCETWNADVKIAISDSGPYFYSDPSVICDAPELLDGGCGCARNPVVIFEVLSPSTRKYERETKTELYKKILRCATSFSSPNTPSPWSTHSSPRTGKWRTKTLPERTHVLKLS